MRRHLGVVFTLLALAVAAPAWAQPDLAGSAIINEPNGFPPGCNQPCYSVEKSFEVYLDGNPSGPGVCPAGSNTFLYTLEHLGGAGPFIFPGVTKFEVTATLVNVTAAGFIPGPDVSPSATNIGPLDTVGWDFQSPVLASGQFSDQLFLCSTSPPGGTTDTMVSTDGQFFLDAPGDCVGPVEAACDLELDKTCCIPTPAAAGVDNCQGKVLELVFEVVGGTCADTTNGQGGKAKCSGADPVPGDFGVVDVVVTKDASKIAIDGEIGGAEGNPGGGDDIPFGSTFTVTNEVDSNGELKSSTKLRVSGPGGTQALTIHTSCSKALSCGDQFGSLKLVTITTTEGGTVDCSTPEQPGTRCTEDQGQEGTACTERPVQIVFEYTGSACQSPLPQPSDKASCSGDPAGTEPVSVTYTGKDPGKFTLSPGSGIEVDDSFAFTATGRDELHSESKFVIQDAGGVVQNLKIHTSCSQPLACGDEFGALKIVEFTQKDGTVVSCDTDPGPLFQDACEVPLAQPAPHCTSKLLELQLAYVGDAFGEGCSVSNGQDGKASCAGVDDPGEPVSVTITEDADEVSADPSSGIFLPTMSDVDVVSITRTKSDGSKASLKSSTKFTVSGPGGSQAIEIHTSCSQPLNLGDVFGSFVVVGLDRKDEGFVGLGGEVEYQFKVTNNSAEDAIVSVMDDPFGTIASGETVAGNGGMKTFFVTKTLYRDLVNQAVATGMTVSGGSCDAPEDTVEVTVTQPPQGSFDCGDAKPIDELSMEWAGGQAICVVAHDGDVDKPTLGTVDNVAIGDVVTIDGMGGSPNDQVWEIFAAGDCGGTRLGTSKFHISCSDDAMNGIEDCGKAQGNGKGNDAGLVDDWLLEGMKGDQTLDCTPDPVIVPGPSHCGIGFELALLLPGLMWLRGRRRRH